MDEKLAQFLGVPSEAEKAAQREVFNAKLKEIFLAGLPDTTGPDFLRAIVESDDWFVATNAAGAFESIDVKPRKYRLAINLGNSPDNKKKKKQGRGGRLLPVYAEKPELPAIQLDGRSLARTLPADIDGILLDLPDKAPQELGREHFADLVVLADAFDLEEILLTPGPGQIEKLKRAVWWVEMAKGELLISTLMGDGRLVQAYTHPDRAGYLSSTKIVEIEGEQLFRLVSENPEVDGIVVNRLSKLGRGENLLNGLALSPGFAYQLLEGEDIRPGAHPLPARNREEVELWLQLRGFPWREREIVEAPFPDAPLMRAVVPEASQWRMQETLGQQSLSAGPTWSLVFVLPPACAKNVQAKESELAAGTTSILCAGLLAKELCADCYNGEGAESYWHVGRRIPFGRFLDEADRVRSRRRLAIATELAKLLPPNADKIPRSALLTVEGAALLGRYPHGGSRAWIEATVQQAARYMKPWVW